MDILVFESANAAWRLWLRIPMTPPWLDTVSYTHLPVESPQEYFDSLKNQGIILDPEERSLLIAKQAEKLAAEVGGKIPEDPDLFEEVTHLIEAPTAFRGSFDPDYLEK